MRRWQIVCALALLAMAFSTSHGVVPETINYQGVLTNADGSIVDDGDYDLTFAVYDVDTGGTALWEETQTLAVSDGIYTAVLGSVTALTLPFDEPYWLGMAVEGDPELTPRMELTAAPYAFRAKHADVSGDDGDWTVVGDDMYASVPGNVGIGTTSPASQLEIRIGEDVGGGIRLSDPSHTIVTLGDGGSSDDVGRLSLYDQATERVRLFAYNLGPSWIAAGNVGIGTMTPTSKLDVTGTATMTGFKMATGAGSGKVLTSNTSGVGTWQTGSAGDITAVYAGSGLTGGATSGAATLNVGAGSGISVAADAVAIAAGGVTYGKLANPLANTGSVGEWELSSASHSITKTTSDPALVIEGTTSGYGDCLHLKSTSGSADTGTDVFSSYTQKGQSAYLSKGVDDGKYAVEIVAADEGLMVWGDFLVGAGYPKSGAVETSQGTEAIFCVEGPEVEICSSGVARLSDGVAHVAFDRLFTESVSSEIDIRVTVTPVGGWSALYLESTDTAGFVVRSASGDPGAGFHWVAFGRRAGFEVRPDVTIPDPETERRAGQERGVSADG